MSPQSANRVENVAIVGAGGHVGKYFAEALVATGKHNVTALTRKGSDTKLPEGVKATHIDYDDEETIVEALKGQQVLIITLSVAAPKETESKLFKAAAKAGVAYVLPNWYAQDPDNAALLKDVFILNKSENAREEITSLGVSSWIQLTCGFWYEFSLAFGKDTFGFDFENRTLTWLDDGETRITSTTWDQCGRAMAALLSLPVNPENEQDNITTLSSFANNVVYVKSFEINQKDLFDSVKRVTETSDKDWTFNKTTAEERYAEGQKEVAAGNMRGFTKVLYSRIFFPKDPGNFDSKVHNATLGLPEEILDERTKVAIEMAKKFAAYTDDKSNAERKKMIKEGKSA
ncbi:hypothetical protein NM208_g11220 [Fusarium decemcellulare]|uniref:Uncharacterized protein n=1 Tax=Fusarium decemcellulare TaxID=57161 RepID=A0ACC1RV48_9HYPO|nr:hypothetical protein NM208_g11220 [Fusarium decemcellulare]